jgi:hypothetical protein
MPCRQNVAIRAAVEAKVPSVATLSFHFWRVRVSSELSYLMRVPHLRVVSGYGGCRIEDPEGCCVGADASGHSTATAVRPVAQSQ